VVSRRRRSLPAVHVGKDECDALTGTLRKEAEGIKTKISDKLAAQNIPG
jgi:hypothetical protein